MAAAGERRDYLPGNVFNIEIDGIVVGNCQKISGLKMETEIITVRDGNDMEEHYRPGRTKVQKITVERGDFRTPELWNWYQEVIKGTAQRKAVSFVVLKRDKSEAMRYNAFECWPCTWEGPDLDANMEGKHQVEKITFVAERLESVRS